MFNVLMMMIMVSVCVCVCPGVYVHTSHSHCPSGFFHPSSSLSLVFHPGPSSSFPPRPSIFTTAFLFFFTLFLLSKIFFPCLFGFLPGVYFAASFSRAQTEKSQTLFFHSKSKHFPLHFPHFTWGMAGRCKHTQTRSACNSLFRICDCSGGEEADEEGVGDWPVWRGLGWRWSAAAGCWPALSSGCSVASPSPSQRWNCGHRWALPPSPGLDTPAPSSLQAHLSRVNIRRQTVNNCCYKPASLMT